MALELMVQKVNNYLVPVTTGDDEAINPLKQGQAFRVSIVKVSDRALKSHRLYWGGLVRLVADYWESDDGLISRYDRKVMSGLIKWVADKGESSETLAGLIDLYLDDRASVIRAHLPEFERASTKLHAVHSWLKEEAGYYDAVLTPTGVRKELHSINFNAMKTEEEFLTFYRRVFAVAWKFVFSKNNFANQEQAENIALEMVRMSR